MDNFKIIFALSVAKNKKIENLACRIVVIYYQRELPPNCVKEHGLNNSCIYL